METLSFINSGLWKQLHASLFESVAFPFVVVYGLVDRWPYQEPRCYEVDSVGNALDDILGSDHDSEQQSMEECMALLSVPFLEKVVLRVLCRDQSEDLKGTTRRCWSLNEIPDDKKTRCAGLIEFEEVDSGERRFLSSRWRASTR